MQKTVAAYLHMSPGAYSKLEKGLKLRISMQQLVALTEILQTSADYLLGLRGGERGEIPDDERCPGAGVPPPCRPCSRTADP
jgi:transcriptional regulator with XRE-family HTH domain